MDMKQVFTYLSGDMKTALEITLEVLAGALLIIGFAIGWLHLVSLYQH